MCVKRNMNAFWNSIWNVFKCFLIQYLKYSLKVKQYQMIIIRLFSILPQTNKNIYFRTIHTVGDINNLGHRHSVCEGKSICLNNATLWAVSQLCHLRNYITEKYSFLWRYLSCSLAWNFYSCNLFLNVSFES